MGPSNRWIRDANGGISQASAKTRVKRDGLPPEVGDGIIAPSLTNSLTGGTTFADAGLIMIFHPHFGGVTIHKPEDVNIDYTGKPVASGFRERTGHRFWRIPIKAPETPETEQMPMSCKPSIVERLLLSKSPTITKEQLSNATEISHNVYELPSIEQGIRYMHATCGYPAKSTWIKAIGKGNYAGWPLLTVENVHKHYPETDETPMGPLNQTRAYV